MNVEVYRSLAWIELGLAGLSFFVLLFVVAPYGRHSRAGWGPTVPSRWAWPVMESPAVWLFLAVFVRGANCDAGAPLVLATLWLGHYLYRGFVFPYRMRAKGRRVPLLIPLLAFAFNLLNASVNATWIGHLASYQEVWLTDPRFVLGMALFLVGLGVNLHSDEILLELRAPGETGYRIPRGGFFQFVSCPNYLGEMVEWTGWALASWSLGGVAFAAFTVANLAPRALATHRWYRQQFPDYPRARRALIPGLL